MTSSARARRPLLRLAARAARAAALTLFSSASLLAQTAPPPATTAATATPARARVALAGSFREVAAPGKADVHHAEITRETLTTAETAEPLEIDVALRTRHFDELERRVAAGETISREEMAARFLPTELQHKAVSAWLVAQGLSVREAGASRATVVATGTPAQCQKAFQTRFARVKFRGEEFTAAVAAPSLPAEVQTLVRSVHGLQPFLRPHKRTIHHQPAVLTATGAPPFLPKDITAAYNIAPTGLTGEGQAIGIIIDETPTLTDLTTFWTNTGVPQNTGNIITVNVRNRTLPAPTGEETLDVAWSSALAPAAKVIVYACGDLYYTNQAYSRVLDDLQSNAQPGLHQVSASFGAGEQDDETPDDISQVHALFTSITAYGVSLFASSGDDGAFGNGGGEGAQAEYPASDPLVTGVGGTSLYLSTNGTISNEVAWSVNPARPKDDSSSGGGVSKTFAQPAYQSGAQVPTYSGRAVPDVAFAGDPATGCYLIFKGRAEQDGGTSWGTPCWAALCALINQARANAGLPALNQLNPSLYPLQGSAAFHDIVSGYNGLSYATSGFDLVTGLGTPDFVQIVKALTANPHPAFFTGEVPLSGGFYYLQFPSGNPFGYYAYQADSRYVYHSDLGFEYVFDAADGKSGVYLYDFASNGFFYTSPGFPFPYLYDFTLKSTLYYYPNTASAGHYTTNPRYFFNFGTGQIITK